MKGTVEASYREFIDYLNESDMSQHDTDVVRSYMDTIIDLYEKEIDELKGK
jgi:hypothetical protein